MSKTDLFYGLALVILGAPGFWQYVVSPFIDKRRKKVTPQDAALIALLHERIYDESEYYQKRFDDTGEGISKARFEYIYQHIYQPYRSLGGNADAEKHINKLRDLIDER